MELNGKSYLGNTLQLMLVNMNFLILISTFVNTFLTVQLLFTVRNHNKETHEGFLFPSSHWIVIPPSFLLSDQRSHVNFILFSFATTHL